MRTMAMQMPPQRGIADVLNEQSDANERGLEGDRRSALTVSQLQGEQQRRELAINADKRAGEAAQRDQIRFGYETDRAEFDKRERARTEELLNSFKASADRHLFKDVPDETKAAIPFDGTPGTVAQPQPMKRVPVDLSTSEGLKAIANFQQEVFSARVKAGKVDQGEMTQLLTFSNMLEQRGNRDMFRKALSGDSDATAQIAKLANLDPTSLKIVGGVNKAGFPDIFALSSKTENGKTTNTTTPIGHLAAIYAPDIYDAVVTKPLGAKKDQTAITTSLTNAAANTKSADAAMMNAETNRSKASSKTANADAFSQLSRLEQTYAKNNYAPGFTVRGPDGKAQSVLDDEASNIVTRIGSAIIDGTDATGGQAHVRARSLLGDFNTQARQDYDKQFAQAQTIFNTVVKQGKSMEVTKSDGTKVTLDPKNKEQVKLIREKFNNMEENGVQIWQGIRNGYANDWLSKNTR